MSAPPVPPGDEPEIDPADMPEDPFPGDPMPGAPLPVPEPLVEPMPPQAFGTRDPAGRIGPGHPFGTLAVDTAPPFALALPSGTADESPVPPVQDPRPGENPGEPPPETTPAQVPPAGQEPTEPSADDPLGDAPIPNPGDPVPPLT